MKTYLFTFTVSKKTLEMIVCGSSKDAAERLLRNYHSLARVLSVQRIG